MGDEGVRVLQAVGAVKELRIARRFLDCWRISKTGFRRRERWPRGPISEAVEAVKTSLCGICRGAIFC